MMARACRHVRRQLSAFYDGELPVGEQIAVQAHLRECPGCMAELGEMDRLGFWLRSGALAASAEPEELEGLPSMVVGRMKAEEAESITGWTGRLFEDMHLVWAALGATCATVACVALFATVSLYAIPLPAGSNKNPMVANAAMSMPSVALSSNSFPAEPLFDEGDLALLLDAVVTREGKIAKLELIQPDGGSKGMTREERQAALALLDLMSKARFRPARYVGSPAPVAVNMVWLYASLTVKAKMPELQLQPRPSRSSRSTLDRSLPLRVRLA